MLNCYLLTQTVSFMKQNQKMFMKIFAKVIICLILSNYTKDSKFLDLVNEKVIGKMKDVHKKNPIRKVVGIKSKMHSILLHDDKKFNTAKGVNIKCNLMNTKTFY